MADIKDKVIRRNVIIMTLWHHNKQKGSNCIKLKFLMNSFPYNINIININSTHDLCLELQQEQ